MNKKLVSYEDIQEALRLTAEAARCQDNVVTIPTTAGPYKMDFKPLALAVVENFAASLKQVSIQKLRPFRGQAYADMAITHAERAVQLLAVARVMANGNQERADALRDALEHLDEARRMTAVCGVKVNEELQCEPGKLVKLGDDFDTKTTVPTL